MMINFHKDGWVFNYRVAGILFDGNRVLLERDLKSGQCCLPGGRVEFGEAASEAVLREMREELGAEVKIERLIWAVDNFFQMNGHGYHEPSFYFLVSLAEANTLPQGEMFPNKDAATTVLQWYSLDQLENVPLYPAFLRSSLQSLPNEPVYIAHRDTAICDISLTDLKPEKISETNIQSDIRCVVFDFAFTLCSDFYCKVTPPECPDWFYQFQRHIWSRHSPYMSPWMTGELTSRDIAEIMTQHLPMSADGILETMEEGCRQLELSPALLSFAKAQQECGRKLALVTVNADLFSRVVVPAHGLDKLFDVIVNSADYRTLSKDHLWPFAFEKLGSDICYGNSLLIEDAENWTRRFGELGGETYLYTTDEAFEKWLANDGHQLLVASQ